MKRTGYTHGFTGLVVAWWFLFLQCGPLRPTKAGEFMVAVAVAQPGSDPSHTGPVLRFTFDGTGALSPLPQIPSTVLNDPVAVSFSPWGELFVSNRHGNVGGGVGSVSRFTFDSSWNFTPSGTISGNSLEAPHGLAFGRSGDSFLTELFAANHLNMTISRFGFSTPVQFQANGVVPLAANAIAGIAFSPRGELFVTKSDPEVVRFLFDSVTGNAMPNPSSPVFTIPGAASLNYLDFNPRGELFVSDRITDLVYRVRFDANDQPLFDTPAIAVTNAFGIAFSPTGELFVSGHETGGMFRFLFDGNGNPIPNGSVSTEQSPLGDLAIMARGPMFIRGDTNGDGIVQLADVVYLLRYFFRSADVRCLDAADANDNEVINLEDIVYLLRHLFSLGPVPPDPFPSCGVDPTLDELSCKSHPCQ